MAKVVADNRVEETVHFAPDGQLSLTYALGCDSSVMAPEVRYTGCEIVVVLPRDEALTWANSDQVGMYATSDLGLHGILELSVEKDFACMDRSDAGNLDAYPNPKFGG